MKNTLIYIFVLSLSFQLSSQQSIARIWNEATLSAIRNDFARPPVHSRNLYHISLAMYEAWAVFDSLAEFEIFSKNIQFSHCNFNGFPKIGNIDSARTMAISFAAYRIIQARFVKSPKYTTTMKDIRKIMSDFGFDTLNVSTDYLSGDAAALGNAIAKCILEYGLADGSNEINNYAIEKYFSINEPLYFDSIIPVSLNDPNRWQALYVPAAIDQNGNQIPPLQKFQSPEWGKVKPFALTNPQVFNRDGNDYTVYHDPGPFPKLDTSDVRDESSIAFKWNMEFVIASSSHLTPLDGIQWDISPNATGNLSKSFPSSFEDYKSFYDFDNGRSLGDGYPENPITKTAYTSQVVNRGDFARVLAQFWADGPNTETPPGHWFTILNTIVSDRITEKRFAGKGKLMTDLEWDLKAYVTLGAAMHDAAISAWGIKGWYDGVRPITAIRYMAQLGQCSDSTKASYHPGGLDLIPGLIELIEANDSLALLDTNNIGKLKIKAWKGHKAVVDYVNDLAGVDWILAERWLPYQEITFVTPPFAGYVSGHSTFSRAAADVLELLTGDPFFPGGLGSYNVQAFRKIIKFEKVPQYDINLEWATYQDASNQSSLSRIWGGIHPPFDDVPGRKIGSALAKDVFFKARELFYNDTDMDGYYSNEDCNDYNPDIHPNAKEIVDGLDNDCNGLIDDVTLVLNEQNKKIHIYPNPNRGNELFINNLSAGIYKVLIFDLGSRICHSSCLEINSDEKVKLDIHELKNGIYFLQLAGNREIRFAKVVISKY